MTGRQDASRHRPRRRSIRARIAIACAGLFLILGGVLIGVTYGLVAHLKPQSSGFPAVIGCGHSRSTDTVGRRRRCVQLLTSRRAGALRQASTDRRGFLMYSLTGLGVATILAGGLGWVVSGRVLRPVRAVTEAARTASQENLGQRLTLAGPPDELKELADTFDAMLARLEAAFASQLRFVANASHELRTPLTEMRALIGVNLGKPARSAEQLEAVLGQVRGAVDKSEELIEALLMLARSDRGPGRTEGVDLPVAVEDAIDLTSRSAAAGQVAIDTALSPVQVTGDRVLLERLVSNLIDNAVRYNRPGGRVLVSLRLRAGRVELAVSNSGEQVPLPKLTTATSKRTPIRLAVSPCG
jgi:signal transduction histidine kinase